MCQKKNDGAPEGVGTPSTSLGFCHKWLREAASRAGENYDGPEFEGGGAQVRREESAAIVVHGTVNCR